MDRFKETTIVIKKINDFHSGKLKNYELVTEVCNYFDIIKNETLNQSDLKFLKYISNVSGIPHYYDLLEKLEKTEEINDINLNTFSSFFYESSLHTDEVNKVHKFQKEILDLFEFNNINRYFLSASTSFGKTHIIFEIIKKMKYDNIVLIFPTIALLSENLEKIMSDERFTYFKNNYKIHTLSEVFEFSERNLFIFTPERFLSFLERNPDAINFDFAFIDEIYKIDNDYLIDEELKENERDVAYRLSVFYAIDKNVDVILAGPYIEFYKKNTTKYNPSFDIFLEKNNIKLLDFNEIEIVNKNFTDIKSRKNYSTTDGIDFQFEKNDGKYAKLEEIISKLKSNQENTIVYCSARSHAENYAKKLTQSSFYSEHNFQKYHDFIEHLEKTFTKNWLVIIALKKGIGIHHSLIPKYIQKEIISLFNEGYINVLFSTTTITEGVNTSAKNLIVLQSEKGDKELKKFDAKNIAGRAGRFLHHFSGRVFALNNDFMKIIDSEPEGIKHKNYDINSPKDEIDLFYTNNEYLDKENLKNKELIIKEQRERKIPDEIFNLYKVISRRDKIILYDKILKLNSIELNKIKTLIRNINVFTNIDHDGFQLVIDLLKSIIKNKKLIFFINYKGNNSEYSTLTHLIYYYLKDGFNGSVNYKLKSGKLIDKAITETSDFVFNILKYQAVKYLGVFNVLYKYIISLRENKSFEEIIGIDKLLVKLEYNALSDNGRIASDFGVPNRIIEYFENPDNNSKIFENFDDYEKKIFQKIQNIINN